MNHDEHIMLIAGTNDGIKIVGLVKECALEWTKKGSYSAKVGVKRDKK